MDTKSKIGSNIRALRKAFGETQEELGFALSLEKTTISNYETGQRQPGVDILKAISDHFSVTVSDLMGADFSSIRQFNPDPADFLKNMRLYLPLACTEEALGNPHFRKACETHRYFYREVSEGQADLPDLFDGCCISEYEEAMEDPASETETAANLLAAAVLIFMIVWASGEKVGSSAAFTLISRDGKTREEAQVFYPEIAKLIRSELGFINSGAPGIRKELDRLLSVVKRSGRWYHLADYYMALLYFYSSGSEGADSSFCSRIGMEMIVSFAGAGNPYASRFMRHVLKFVKTGPRNVDDR